MALHADEVEGLTVPSVFEAGPSFLAKCRFVLVTSVDSIREVANLPLGSYGHEHLGSGALFEVPAFRRLMAHRNFFTGFDEVWLFEERPGQPMPPGASITSEAPIDPERDLAGVAAWMAGNRCLVGLGDGYGLNYVTLLDDVAREMDALAVSG
jgi:hypothetical protein